ncbi:Crp/Fnr family transcriptional regulator [Mucilaginibacter sp. SJ]|uniref:Crp/Fnr family transcriptional regulator n=1 Tax=Mucilaginibacter sp. SJ TaxID=3029053 RepID=UPI0023A9D4AC|nr:Crp/Fnr family transcriptional regulator [Mucilaginibacter sp. SJ]WEA01127.1 Crp/Fnr family transcriptional regulator [Mucilaginibacter sp. SJ]
MNKDSLVQFIQQVLPMSPAKVGVIAEKFKPLKIEKNNYLLKTGKVCSESHFIEKGIVRSYIYDVKGNEVTTAFYSQNSFASDLLSFFKRSPTKENIQAVTDCETWYITYEDMQESFHTMPEFRDYGRLNLVDQYSKLKERMLSMLQETAEQRYEALISSSPEIFQNVPLKYIASYLGVTDTSLSRIRKEFIKK